MSLLERVIWPYANQARRQTGNFPLPLRRKKRKGEQLDPNQFAEALGSRTGLRVGDRVYSRRGVGSGPAGTVSGMVGEVVWLKPVKSAADRHTAGKGQRRVKVQWKPRGNVGSHEERQLIKVADAVAAGAPGSDSSHLSEQSPTQVPGTGWLRLRYPAGTKYAGKADAVISGGPDAKKVADALRWFYPGKRVVREARRSLLTLMHEAEPTASAPPFKVLKKHRVKLQPDERQCCFDRKAVWNSRLKRNERTGKLMHLPVPAVWKAEIGGKTWYVTNTHRAYNVRSTLKGAIGRFHDFIRSTA